MTPKEAIYLADYCLDNTQVREALKAMARQVEELQDSDVQKVKMLWECNECGSQEYTMAVSEQDIQNLGCSNCGACEWHKSEERQ